MSYIVIGLPILLYSQFTDMWAFLKSAFSRKKTATVDDIFVIEHIYFKIFHRMLYKIETVDDGIIISTSIKAVWLIE